MNPYSPVTSSQLESNKQVNPPFYTIPQQIGTPTANPLQRKVSVGGNRSSSFKSRGSHTQMNYNHLSIWFCFFISD